MAMLRTCLIYILLLCFAFQHLEAQEQASAPIITNYDPTEYAQCVNDIHYLDNNTKQGVKTALAGGWGTTQASNGKIYFAMTAGVLEFDGQRWDIIFLAKSITDNLIPARSIRYDKHTDKVYVGGENEFGYLEKQQNGKMRYISLYDKFKEKYNKK